MLFYVSKCISIESKENISRHPRVTKIYKGIAERGPSLWTLGTGGHLGRHLGFSKMQFSRQIVLMWCLKLQNQAIYRVCSGYAHLAAWLFSTLHQATAHLPQSARKSMFPTDLLYLPTLIFGDNFFSWSQRALLYHYAHEHVSTHMYSISQEICTRFLLCCALLWLYIDWFSHIHQAYFTGTVTI